MGQFAELGPFIVMLLELVNGVKKLGFQVFLGRTPLDIEFKMPFFRLFKGFDQLE